MENDEALKTQYGTRIPFTVPEGYFDQLGEVVMESISRRGSIKKGETTVAKTSLWSHVSPFLAAACFVGVVLFVGLTVSSPKAQDGKTATSSMASSSSLAVQHDDDLDRLADYVMMDEDDAYAYFSAE